MKFFSAVSALSAGKTLTEFSNSIIYICILFYLSALFMKLKRGEKNGKLFRESFYSADTLTNPYPTENKREIRQRFGADKNLSAR
jgi:hypothetical protein